MRDLYIFIIVATATLFSLTAGQDNLEVGARNEKLISTFQIVRFPNDGCVGSSATRNGTCYTSAECSDKGGSSSGSCADGFGVCCTFTINTCGGSASENTTYWDAPATVPPGECNLYVNAVNDNICQLRLDFTTFVITGPSTATQSDIGVFASGIPGGGVQGNFANTLPAANAASWTTNCLTDSFSVSSPNPANKPPTLCGVITGNHMYVDVDSDTSNILSFIFQRNAFAGVAQAQDTRGIVALAARDWDITIMQYDCGYVNRAPVGCTQYLWSDTGLQVDGWVTTYNWQGNAAQGTATTKHLANQNQKICIRRERTICWASFYMGPAITSFFELSGDTNGGNLQALSHTAAGTPCGYNCEIAGGIGAAGNACAGYDCVIIPGLFGVVLTSNGAAVIAAATAAQVRLGIVSTTNHSPAGPQVAGSGGFSVHAALDGTATRIGDAIVATTYFTAHVPFQVQFKSDGHEGTGNDMEALEEQNSIGMKLQYSLIPCTA